MKNLYEEIKNTLDGMCDEPFCFFEADDIIDLMYSILEEFKENQSNKTLLERLQDERDDMVKKLAEMKETLKKFKLGEPSIDRADSYWFMSRKDAIENYLYVLEQSIDSLKQAEKEQG